MDNHGIFLWNISIYIYICIYIYGIYIYIYGIYYGIIIIGRFDRYSASILVQDRLATFLGAMKLADVQLGRNPGLTMGGWRWTLGSEEFCGCTLLIGVISVIIIDYHWWSLMIIDYHWWSLIIIDDHWLSWMIIDYHSGCLETKSCLKETGKAWYDAILRWILDLEPTWAMCPARVCFCVPVKGVTQTWLQNAINAL